MPCVQAKAAPMDKDPAHASGSFNHLSGSALSSAFSKALMKSNMTSAEKARILTEVTSIADIEMKEWQAGLVGTIDLILFDDMKTTSQNFGDF